LEWGQAFISPGGDAMVAVMRMLVLAAALIAAPALGFAADVTSISPKGEKLAQALDSMGVESKWIAGQHIDWETGLPDGRPERMPGKHTHCSAFVAAAAQSLGVHILRPPEHGQKLLANAQYHWLESDGAAEGWRELPDPAAAQAAANAGELVVASYLSHNEEKPGHIAIVKPAARSAAELAAAGPLLIQAGTVNSAAISMRDGFAGHPHAWFDHEAVFYAHPLP